MKFKTSLILTAFIIVFTSCSDEIEMNETQIVEKSSDYKEIQVLNGRLYFPNQSTFQDYYTELKDKDENEIAEILQKRFYSKDFYSLKPIINDQTEEVQFERHLGKIKNNLRGLRQGRNITDEALLENLDDLEDIIGEGVFTSLLNQEAEIQVNNKIYKYTDTGLFIVVSEKINELNAYLKQKEISTNLFQPTSETARISYLENNRCGGNVIISDAIEYFVAEPIIQESCGGGGYYGGGYNGGGSSGGGNTNPQGGTPSDELAKIANDLQKCSGSKPWLGNIFGTTRVCIDRYERKKRVKIKYYNVNFFLVYAVGIKVKHQKRGWTGLWRRQKTSEVALGVNSLSWKFTIPTPPGALLSYQPARIWLDDGKMYKTSNDYYNAVYFGDIPVPNLPFAHKVDAIIEVAVNTPWFNDEEDVREFIYQRLFDTTKNLLRQNRNKQLKRLGVVVATQTQSWVQYYDFSESCTNCSRKHEVIDFGAVTPEFNYTFGTGNGGSFNITSWDYNFSNPSVTGMNAFGMAKRSGVWHGKRFVF